MIKVNVKPNKLLVLLMLSTWICTQVLIPVINAQEASCSYYRVGSASLEGARQSFRALEYDCVMKETNELRENTSVAPRDRIKSYLIQAVAEALLPPTARPSKSTIIGDFKSAYMEYYQWQEESGEAVASFESLIAEVPEIVDPLESISEISSSLQQGEQEAHKEWDEIIAARELEKPEGKKWYKKWWAYALGVGVVAAVVVAASGGGDDGSGSGGGNDTIPDFPPPPGK